MRGNENFCIWKIDWKNSQTKFRVLLYALAPRHFYTSEKTGESNHSVSRFARLAPRETQRERETTHILRQPRSPRLVDGHRIAVAPVGPTVKFLRRKRRAHHWTCHGVTVYYLTVELFNFNPASLCLRDRKISPCAWHTSFPFSPAAGLATVVRALVTRSCNTDGTCVQNICKWS